MPSSCCPMGKDHVGTCMVTIGLQCSCWMLLIQPRQWSILPAFYASMLQTFRLFFTEQDKVCPPAGHTKIYGSLLLLIIAIIIIILIYFCKKTYQYNFLDLLGSINILKFIESL